MLAEALVLIEEKYGRGQGQVPSWTIFLILEEIIQSESDRSVQLSSQTKFQNIYSIHAYYFCKILPMLAEAFVLVEEKYGRGQGQEVPSWTIFLIMEEIIQSESDRSIHLSSLPILQNIYSIHAYYFCKILPMLAEALVLVKEKYG